MKLNPNQSSYSFSIDFDNNIDISVNDENNPVKSVIIFLKSLVQTKKITVGEKCEGEIDINDKEIVINYKWCSDVGEDYDDDIWNEETYISPNKQKTARDIRNSLGLS